jgi:hypothetical protein
MLMATTRRKRTKRTTRRREIECTNQTTGVPEKNGNEKRR